MIDYGNRNDIKFFVVNKKLYQYTLTLASRKSKRSEITGRVCDTFKYDILEQIATDIKMNTKGKIKKGQYCVALEFFLRYKQLNDDKVWFVNKINH